MTINNGYSSTERNHALCRKDLDFIPNGNFISNGYEECQNMQFFKINGFSRFWETEQDFSINSLVGDILNSCVRHGIPFAYVIIGNESGIEIYVGTMKILRDGLKSSYESVFPGIDIEYVFDNPMRTCPRDYGGMFTGIPTDKLGAEKKSFQIENICRGMQGKRYTYVVLASGISNIAVTLGHEKILEEMEGVFSFINQTISGGTQGNLSAQKQDFTSKNYFENLEVLEQILKNGVARGMWRVNGYYASDNPMDAKRLGNIIKASFSGEESKPEPFRIIEYNSIRDVISNTYMMADLIDNPELHPLGKWQRQGVAQPITLFIYKFQTVLNSDQLATLCQLPMKEFSGFYIDQYVEFDVSNRTKGSLINPISIGDICIAGRKDNLIANNVYLMEKNDFTRHALIIGITGGGKTNTSKSILNTLWNAEERKEKVPFMVIESAKREYWELRNLKGFEDLLVFTLGAEAVQTSVRYRINPFETNSKISLQTHIDYLLSTFKAAFDLYPPMPYILEKAVYEIYSDRGWDIVENINRFGLTEYPTLSNLYNKIDVIVDNMGYHQEVQSNVKAALQARVYSLMIGGKGAMLNTPKSVPIEELLSRPVVMELEDLGDDETKSFVIGILLVQLYEYRKSQMTKGSKQLSHILMVEEAHRLLKNVSEAGEGGNTRAKSVEFFCNLLAEIRTFGQGILIADQIPTKLAPDTIKNTNLKIVHRTVALEDRETIGKAMNMSSEQIEYLSSLRRGYAAIYAEGDNRPKCVKLPLIQSYYEKSRDEVITEVKKKVYGIASEYDELVSHHAGCSYCENRCKYYKDVCAYIDVNVATDKVLEKWTVKKYAPRSFVAFLNSELMKNLDAQSIFKQICILGYILNQKQDLNDGQRQKCLSEYLRYIKNN
jgi:hypothetical protein